MARLYTVCIERTEKYSLPVNVRARNAEEAEAMVRAKDDSDEYLDIWNELQPDVETEYNGAVADNQDAGEGPYA